MGIPPRESGSSPTRPGSPLSRLVTFDVDDVVQRRQEGHAGRQPATDRDGFISVHRAGAGPTPAFDVRTTNAEPTASVHELALMCAVALIAREELFLPRAGQRVAISVDGVAVQGRATGRLCVADADAPRWSTHPSTWAHARDLRGRDWSPGQPFEILGVRPYAEVRAVRGVFDDRPDEAIGWADLRSLRDASGEQLPDDVDVDADDRDRFSPPEGHWPLVRIGLDAQSATSFAAREHAAELPWAVLGFDPRVSLSSFWTAVEHLFGQGDPHHGWQLCTSEGTYLTWFGDWDESTHDDHDVDDHWTGPDPHTLLAGDVLVPGAQLSYLSEFGRNWCHTGRVYHRTVDPDALYPVGVGTLSGADVGVLASANLSSPR